MDYAMTHVSWKYDTQSYTMLIQADKEAINLTAITNTV